MRLWITVAFLVAALSGCQHYSLLTQEDFERGSVPKVQFERDNYTCATNAVVQQNIVGGGDTRGVYNETYAACMAKLGYRTRNIDLLGISG